MFSLARHNLFQSRTKALMAIASVALAMMLVLSLDGILAGLENRIGAFIETAGADVWVAQAGVQNMHMASSSVPRGLADQVSQVPGVAEAMPMRYLTNVVVSGNDQYIAYVIGLPEGATMGRPKTLIAGPATPKTGQVVIDGALRKVGAKIGDRVRILGTEFTISGLSEGLASSLSSLAFIPLSDLDRLVGNDRTVSYVLVRAAPGVAAEALAADIASRIPGVTASTRATFAGEERRVVRDMSIEIAVIMNLAGLLIGLAVMGLSVYTTTVSRLPEYGMLKALGASTRRLAGVVVSQAAITVAIGLLVGLALAYATAFLAPRLDPILDLRITSDSVVKVAAISFIVAALSAIAPIVQIAGLDPAVVFRRRFT